MRTDLYTKVMLTVIAVCLVWIALGGPSLLTPVSAQADAKAKEEQHVIISGWTYGDPNGPSRDREVQRLGHGSPLPVD